MKLVFLLVIYLGAALAAENSFDVVNNSLINEWMKFIEKLREPLDLMDPEEKFVLDVEEMIQFTNRCVLMVSAGMKMSSPNMSIEIPNDIYCEIKKNIALISKNGVDISDQLNSLVDPDIQVEKSVIENLNKVHLLIYAILLRMVNSMTHPIDITEGWNQLQRQNASIENSKNQWNAFISSAQRPENIRSALDNLNVQMKKLRSILDEMPPDSEIGIILSTTRMVTVTNMLIRKVNEKKSAGDPSNIKIEKYNQLEEAINAITTETGCIVKLLSTGTLDAAVLTRASENLIEKIRVTLDTTKISLLKEMLATSVYVQNAALAVKLFQIGEQFENIKPKILQLGDIVKAAYKERSKPNWPFMFVLSASYLTNQCYKQIGKIVIGTQNVRHTVKMYENIDELDVIYNRLLEGNAMIDDVIEKSEEMVQNNDDETSANGNICMHGLAHLFVTFNHLDCFLVESKQ